VAVLRFVALFRDVADLRFAPLFRDVALLRGAAVFRFDAVFRFEAEAVFRFAAVFFLVALFEVRLLLGLLVFVLVRAREVFVFARVRVVAPDLFLLVLRVFFAALFVLLLRCDFFVALFRDVLLVFVFDREPVVRVFVERDERRAVREPPLLRSPSSAPSPSSPLPRSFFATTAAAGTARPSAVPATTFVGMDIPCSSRSSSSFDMVASLGAPAVELGDLARRYFASLNPSMNFGTIRFRRNSGPFAARYLPAASAASSAIGRSAFAAAPQLVAAADARIDGELPSFPFRDDVPPSSRSSPFDLPPSCERIRLTA
jgi:hypothetical protein